MTDTGCDTEVRNLIQRYSDNIIDFNWIQDFAARNAGLMRAKGLWFMYLDDDEWFDDTTDIIDFYFRMSKNIMMWHYIISAITVMRK